MTVSRKVSNAATSGISSSMESSRRASLSERPLKTNIAPMHGVWTLTERDVRKIYTTPISFLFTAIQPVIWLVLYGKALNFGEFTYPIFGTSDYFSYLATGMLSFIVLFAATFSGVSVVFDRISGYLDEILSTPAARGAIVLSKVVSNVIKSLIQGVIVLAVAVLLGMPYGLLSVYSLATSFAALTLMALGLSSIFVMSSLRSTNWQTQLGAANLLNLPLLFASNVLFPTDLMPAWMSVLVALNPLSHATDIARQLMIGSPGQWSLSFDFEFLIIFALVFSVIGIVSSWRLLRQ